jgi:hypothetical protein
MKKLIGQAIYIHNCSNVRNSYYGEINIMYDIIKLILKTETIRDIVWNSVSQPPGRDSVPGPGINYIGSSSHKIRSYLAAVSRRLRTTGIEQILAKE